MFSISTLSHNDTDVLRTTVLGNPLTVTGGVVAEAKSKGIKTGKGRAVEKMRPVSNKQKGKPSGKKVAAPKA